MCRDEMVQLLEAALKDLCAASQELTRVVTPPVPTPRPRIFHIAPGWTYPYTFDWCDRQLEHWYALSNPYGEQHSIDVSEFRLDAAAAIGDAVRWRPRAILRVIRRLQAAAAWCRARKAGRQRASQEILRQQRRAVEALEAEIRELRR